MKKVLIIGASGFIGTALLKGLKGYEIHSLKGRSVHDMDIESLSIYLSGYDAVINLAGKSILGRWTKNRKRKIYESRILTTRKIVSAVLKAEMPPKHFINASAIGIYKPEVEVNESSLEKDDSFLARVVSDWEKEASKIQSNKIKLTVIRIGVVLGKSHGAYKILRYLYSINLGAYFNGGSQSLSYIGIHDLVRAVDFILTKELGGAINLVNPEYSNYKELDRILRKTLGAWFSWNLPGLFMKVALCEGSLVFLQGHKVLPSVLLKNNFNFETPNLQSCVAKLEEN